MLCAFITHADCARHEMGADHPECPERLGAIRDLLLIKGLLDHMTIHDAPLASVEQLTRAHTASYVQGLIAAAPTEGHRRVDPDTCMNPFTIAAARRAAGAAVLATDLCSAAPCRPRSAACARPATTPNALQRWGSASSTMSRSGSAMRSWSMACSGLR